jgi:hypothetical protein
MSGASIAIWRISARFFSPPEKPSLRWREVNELFRAACPGLLAQLGQADRLD